MDYLGEMFDNFQFKNVVLNVISDVISINNMVIDLDEIIFGSQKVKLILSNDRIIEFQTDYDPILDEKGKLTFLNGNNDCLTLEVSKLQKVRK